MKMEKEARRARRGKTAGRLQPRDMLGTGEQQAPAFAKATARQGGQMTGKVD